MMVDDEVGGTAVMKCFCKTNNRNHTHTHTEQGTPGLTAASGGSGGEQTLTPVMKMLLSLMLLSLLVSPVLSLDCYVCSSSATNEECNKNTQECQAPLDTCMTVVDTLGTVKAIVKQCASRATCRGAASTASVDSDGNGNTINCCSSFNLCNFSGAESIHTHTTLLLLTVGVLLLLSH